MTEWITRESPLRLAVFVGALVLLLALERAWPRRRDDPNAAQRWPANLGLAVIDSAVLLLLPLAAVGTAALAQARGFGLFNVLHAPAWLAAAVSVVALDLAIYGQHRALHEVRVLWPLHRVHHSDVTLDATTGVRFHPVEILLSMLWKMALVAAVGAPVAAVVAYEIALNLFSLWSHANLRLPAALERALRRVVITPDTHRVHHSVHRDETDSNYANLLIVWDHLFGSFRAAPRDGHESMQLGLAQFRQAADQRLTALLAQPGHRL